MRGSHSGVGKRIVLRLSLPFSFQRVAKNHKAIEVGPENRLKVEVLEEN